MTKSVLTPVDESEATVVDLANGIFRKEILRPSTIKYKGRQKTFTPAYIKALKESFDKKLLVDDVPAQLAPGNNAHTNDVERTGGQLTGVELTADNRLIGVFSLNERGAKVVEDSNRRVGVSARIIEGAEGEDGTTITAAMQHVLLTVDPRVRGMAPWEKVDLSEDDSDITETLDLSAAAWPGDTEDKVGNTKPELVTVELSQEDATALTEMLADRKKAVELADAKGAAGDDEDEEDDSEDDDTDSNGKKLSPKALAFKKMLAKKKGSKEKATALSNDEIDAIELATATAEAADARVVELSRQLLEANTDREVNRFLDAGLAPAIVELARPLLAAGVEVIELSNGETVDPGEVLREVLNEIIELSVNGTEAVVELGRERGSLEGTESDIARRAAQLKLMAENTPAVY